MRKNITLIITLVIVSMMGFYAMASSKPIVTMPLNDIGSSAYNIGIWGIGVSGHAYSIGENGQKVPLRFYVSAYKVVKYNYGYIPVYYTITISAGGSGYGSATFSGFNTPQNVDNIINQPSIISGPTSTIVLQ